MASLETTTNIHMQVQVRPSSVNQIKTQEPIDIPTETTTAGQFLRRLFKLLFYLHLIFITIFVIFLTLYGLIFTTRTRHFRPLEYYPPLLTAIGCSATVAFIWQWITSSSPSKAIQVIKNTLLVTISRIKYMNFAFGIEIDTREASRDTIKHLTGSICIGSILVPVLGVVRGSARAMKLTAGDTDEFLFSCANCYSRMASTLVMYGNRWGFVHVSAYNKGFVQASSDTWEKFENEGLKELIDSDLTGSFCFLSGVAVGAICSLVSGTWALIIHKSYATEVSIYAFFIGYFMCRVAMAWPQACVSSYYVAYSEDPQSVRFDSTIPARVEELQRFQA
ncbi:protein PNS1 isoform X2 [Pyrus x bretschneideri]|uniref:protein PNS1 isoform X2 n=1 Tax=Pyrus x bretschneideri TaxID=225117 RepID=UPI00202E6867|nr:protein PNS1 isoform X2 [Pyrus x bretschneideri]